MKLAPSPRGICASSYQTLAFYRLASHIRSKADRPVSGFGLGHEGANGVYDLGQRVVVVRHSPLQRGQLVGQRLWSNSTARSCTKARTTYTLISTALSELSTLAAMMAPCS